VGGANLYIHSHTRTHNIGLRAPVIEELYRCLCRINVENTRLLFQWWQFQWFQ
jgi:hypothetical protein